MLIALGYAGLFFLGLALAAQIRIFAIALFLRERSPAGVFGRHRSGFFSGCGCFEIGLGPGLGHAGILFCGFGGTIH